MEKGTAEGPHPRAAQTPEHPQMLPVLGTMHKPGCTWGAFLKLFCCSLFLLPSSTEAGERTQVVTWSCAGQAGAMLPDASPDAKGHHLGYPLE